MSERVKGDTSVSLIFRLTDSTTGAAKSGVDVTTLMLQYSRPGEAPSVATSLTLLGSETDPWTAFGAIEVDPANSKGVYRIDCPNDGFAIGTPDEVAWSVSGSGIETCTRLIDLTAFDARNGSTGGFTGLIVDHITGVTLPSVVPSLANIEGALPTDLTIATDVQAALDLQGYSSARAGYLDVLNGLVANIWDSLVGGMTTVNSIGKKLADWVLGTDNKVLLSTNAQAGVVLPHVTLVDTITTYTGDTPQTGDSFIRLGSPVGASISADIAGVPAAYLDLPNGIETDLTPRQAYRLMAAALAGQLTGASTTTITIKAAGVPGTTRILATVDSSGDRTALILTP